MARARNIKPGFFKNEYLGGLDPHARLLFIGLWMMADREGRLEDRPLRIKAEVFPYESVQVEKLLDQLDSCGGGLIERYTVDGDKYIQIINFSEHQNPHKNEKDSVIPAPDANNRVKAESAPEKAQPNLAESLLLNPESLIPIREGEKRKRFIPPTTEEVSEYCKKMGYTIDTQRFVDFYESKGWMVGKNKMKDWKAAVRSWQQRDKSEAKPQQKKTGFHLPESRGDKYTDDQLEKILLKKGKGG